MTLYAASDDEAVPVSGVAFGGVGVYPRQGLVAGRFVLRRAERRVSIVTRSVSEGSCLDSLVDAQRDNWWAERGSIRWLWDEDDIEGAIRYVTEGQDRRPNDH